MIAYTAIGAKPNPRQTQGRNGICWCITRWMWRRWVCVVGKTDDKLMITLNQHIWGKYDSVQGYHPAIYHMLDVALVAEALLAMLGAEERKRLLSPFAESQNPIAVFVFIIALHDLGKITPGFQLKIQEWRIRLIELGFDWDDIAEKDNNAIHGCTGYALLSGLLEQNLQLDRQAAKALANSVAGHHGSFFHVNPKKLRMGADLWEAVRHEAIQWLQEQLEVEWHEIHVLPETVTPAYVAYLAGFCTVADWLGSDETIFTYLNESPYVLSDRKAIAQQQVRELQLKDVGLAQGESKFEDLFPFHANATQASSLEIFNNTQQPVLTIIETPMGSGKTEAALALADKYIREQGKTGFYFALPTQATGNQLFERTIEFFQKHPAKTANLELHLRHSNASLNAQYEALQVSSVNHNQQESVIASHWFTSHKRGLLSAYAVGTVDQCLLAALQVRHFFVRLFGLSNKVVIIDEVHAYDTYTSRILEGLLSWLAVLQTPVILLSATLPASRRKALMAAYHQQEVSLIGSAQAYPRISCLSTSGRYTEQYVKDQDSTLPSAFQIRLVQTSLRQRWQKVKTILDDSLAEGGCAACIVNTVNDAQTLFKELRDHYQNDSEIELILFHARFPLYQRLEIEKTVKKLFGKGEDTKRPNPNRPRKAIVVATQVLEQSLDVDFDLMISMLAPIDLLLQRAGRIHRHDVNHPIRPAKLSEPVLYCLHPDIAKDTDSPEHIFGNAEAYIYEPHSLFYTVISLQNRAKQAIPYSVTTVAMPEDMEALIDDVYEGQLKISDEQQKQKGEDWEFLARDVNRRKIQYANKLLLPEPTTNLRTFFRNLEESEDDENVALTRLVLPSIALVLMTQNEENQWYLIEDEQTIDLAKKPDKSTQYRLVRSSVRISHPDWVEHFKQQAAPKAWQKVAVLRDCYPLYLNDAGKFLSKDVKGNLEWNRELGVVINR